MCPIHIFPYPLFIVLSCVGIGGESRLREYHSCLAILESVKEVELAHTFYAREKFALKKTFEAHRPKRECGNCVIFQYSLALCFLLISSNSAFLYRHCN